MLRKDLLSAIKEKVSANGVSLTKEQLGVVFDTVLTTIGEEVLKGETVSTPIGNFKLTESASRAGHNPKTGEAITIAARSRVAFKASKAFTVVED